MSYYYRNRFPLLLENRLSGVLNEYAELNDIAAKNNFIYTQNMISNCNPNYPHYIPPLYSYPYYRPPYYIPYIYGGGYGYDLWYGYR